MPADNFVGAISQIDFIDGYVIATIQNSHTFQQSNLEDATVWNGLNIETLSYFPDTEDTPFSLDEIDFAHMVRHVKDTWAAMQPAPIEVENSSRPLRRSLFAVADIPKGARFTENNIRSIRPGHGVTPAALPQFIGQRSSREIKRGEPLNFDMIYVSEAMIEAARK